MMKRRNHGSVAMIIDCTRMRLASKTRLWLAPILAALLALGAARSANAQLDAHDLMEGRGRDVSLPVSCGADIQPRFDAALAALHSFWYGQALKEFTAITEAKPDCAMAYWGIAMSIWNQIWAPPTPANLARKQRHRAGSGAGREDPPRTRLSRRARGLLHGSRQARPSHARCGLYAQDGAGCAALSR